MAVTITAADANGLRPEGRVCRVLSTDTARAMIRLVQRRLTREQADVTTFDDDVEVRQYGEDAEIKDPAAFGAIFLDRSAFDAADNSIIDAFGQDTIKEIVALDQVTRLQVPPAWTGLEPYVESDGLGAAEPVLSVCPTNADRALRQFGLEFAYQGSATFNAREVLAAEDTSRRYDDHAQGLLEVAAFAVHRFGRLELSAARARGMKLLKEATLGGALSLDDTAFAKKVAATVIRKIVGSAAAAAAPTHPIEGHRLAIAESAASCQEDGSVHACSGLYFKITFSLISKGPIDPSLDCRLRSLISAVQLAMKMVLRTHDVVKDPAALDDVLAMAVAIASLCGSENFDRDQALGLLANSCAALLPGQACTASVVAVLAA
ncbi:hypothetical protein JKP88DRAFT_255999 [Tribonema minus]|uniref:Uncharacterized protein n=1 Tax=Tribonema minus TaxID=303371 RepID=A0A836CEC8_9STRA|nr:hypothetical protein JKP88DRAFT_255999 [Tribonema minus]